jgi:hypothetical protein
MSLCEAKMKKRILLVGMSATLLSISQAAEWSGKQKTLQATYLIHSGDVGDRGEPTFTDRRLAIAIKGDSAKEIFDMIGPDLRATCSGRSGERDRLKGDLFCTYHATGAASGYRCWIGVDLRHGKSISAVSC